METIKAYIALTKPRVIELLLVATFPAMIQADRGTIHLRLIILTLIGGWMGAAAANTFNMVADSDIDALMGRTSKRPLANSIISTRAAAIFAWILTLLSFFWLTFLCHSLTAAVFVMITIAFYIFVYTKWLKRRTHLNVVWGGAAGCMPVLVGWASVTDALPDGTHTQWWQAFVLFLIIFFWTPPHTWALGMKYKDDYKAAGVPMLPVVKSPDHVTRHMLYYTIGTVLCSWLLLPATGWLYTVASVAAGLWFSWEAYVLYRRTIAGKDTHPFKLFIVSNNYLALLFVALTIDGALGLTTLAEGLGWNTVLF